MYSPPPTPKRWTALVAVVLAVSLSGCRELKLPADAVLFRDGRTGNQILLDESAAITIHHVVAQPPKETDKRLYYPRGSFTVAGKLYFLSSGDYLYTDQRTHELLYKAPFGTALNQLLKSKDTITLEKLQKVIATPIP